LIINGRNANYDDCPAIGIKPMVIVPQPIYSDNAEVSFSGRHQNYCVCFIDMMNSTTITATLSDIKLRRYYATFLNSMATIIRNFGGKIIKNAGDCLIYYFPATSDTSDTHAFGDALECCMTMTGAHGTINAALKEEKLPPLNYRISADYGAVEIAHSTASNNDDLFGTTMNVCAKINSKAAANSVVMGADLRQILQSLSFNKDYQFKEIGVYQIGNKQKYSIFSIARREKRNILNPFKRTSHSLQEPHQ
jgi:class 3 adenylate cyclase